MNTSYNPEKNVWQKVKKNQENMEKARNLSEF